MKKNFLLSFSALLCASALILTGCSNNDDPKPDDNNHDSAATLDYNEKNAASWGNYMGCFSCCCFNYRFGLNQTKTCDNCQCQSSAEIPKDVGLNISALEAADSEADFLSNLGKTIHSCVNHMTVKPCY